MKQKYTIAVSDILGFSQLVKRTDLDALVTNTLDWFRKALSQAVNKDGWPEQTPTLAEIDRNSLVGIAWFSDTVLLYTKEDNDENVRELLQTVAWLTFATMIGGVTRMRSGIAYGDAFIDASNSLFVGDPIIDAYRLEQQQQWSGAALTQSACERVPAMFHGGGYADWPVLTYDVPLKDGVRASTLAINWTYGFHDSLAMNWSAGREQPSIDDWASNRSVCEKWANTREFHASVCQSCSQR